MLRWMCLAPAARIRLLGTGEAEIKVGLVTGACERPLEAQHQFCARYADCARHIWSRTNSGTVRVSMTMTSSPHHAAPSDPWLRSPVCSSPSAPRSGNQHRACRRSEEARHCCQPSMPECRRQVHGYLASGLDWMRRRHCQVILNACIGGAVLEKRWIPAIPGAGSVWHGAGRAGIDVEQACIRSIQFRLCTRI